MKTHIENCKQILRSKRSIDFLHANNIYSSSVSLSTVLSIKSMGSLKSLVADVLTVDKKIALGRTFDLAINRKGDYLSVSDDHACKGHFVQAQINLETSTP